MRSGLRVKRAESFWDRLLGVGFQVSWRDFDALCLPRCRTVHTFALTKPIDVVFVSVEGVILGVHSRVPPWRIVIAVDSKAVDIWEFPAGACQRHAFVQGRFIKDLLTADLLKTGWGDA